MDDVEIPYTTKEGIEYLITFKYFAPEHIPLGINVPIIDIAIITTADIDLINNSSTDIFEIGNIIYDQANKVDAVYYCICSDKQIKKNIKREHLSHQQYRSHLFSALFLKCNKGNLYSNRLVVIDDPNTNNHYIHLIATEKNSANVDLISEELRGFDKPN
jgi:hypothetical protein